MVYAVESYKSNLEETNDFFPLFPTRKYSFSSVFFFFLIVVIVSFPLKIFSRLIEITI